MVRFTINPNNNFDINNLRIALLNYIISKQKDDIFILKVEDIEIKDNIDKKVGEIKDILKKFSITEEQIIYQSDNLKIYQQFAYQLVRNKSAYLCFCLDNSRKCSCQNLPNNEIESKLNSKEKYSIYIKNTNQSFKINDIIQGEVVVNSLNSFLILDENETPAGIFANAIDDMLIGTSIAINSYDLLKDTIKQIYIHNLLGYNQNIHYAHLPAITDSKSIKELFYDGYIPDAIINYILNISYNNANKEIFYLPDAIEWYDISKVSKESIGFDLNTLKFLNQKHLYIMDNKKLSSIFGFADEDIGRLLKLYLKNISTINELDAVFKDIFSKKECNNIMKELSNIIMKAPMIDDFEGFKSYLLRKSKMSEEELLKNLKLLIAGNSIGVELKDIYMLIKPYILEVAKCH